MTSTTLELQGAIAARLKAVSAVTALIGQRVYDDVPEEKKRIQATGAAFPYVSFGPSDELPDNAECIQADVVTFQLDAWSRAVGFPEVRQTAAAVRAALHEYEFTLTANALVSFEHRATRIFRDPDGLTSHAAIEFRAIVEIKP